MSNIENLNKEEELKGYTFTPHIAGQNLVVELALKLYNTHLDPLREAISNAIDAGASEIYLTYTNSEKQGKIEWIIEDNGHGITKKIIEFATFGIDSKAVTRAMENKSQIGEKGLGKLSYLKLGNTVWFKTNNGEVGHDIRMTLDGFQHDTMNARKYIEHRGTKVIIKDLVSLPSDFAEQAYKYLSRVFSLILVKGYPTGLEQKMNIPKIYLNGIKLEPKLKYDFTEKHIKTLAGAFKITGNIVADKKGNGSVDVFINRVLVTIKHPLVVDPSRMFSGWINCDKITPNTSRDDISEDKYSQELLGKLKDYVIEQKFPLRETSNLNERSINLVKDTLAKYMKSLELNDFFGKDKPKGLSDPNGIEGTRINRKHPKPASPLPHCKIIRNNNKDSGEEKKRRISRIKVDKKIRSNLPEIERIDGGENRLPFYYDALAKKVYFNYTNPLFNIYNDPANNDIPYWFRMASHMIRIATQISPQCQEIARNNIDDLYMIQDKLMALTLSEHNFGGLEEFGKIQNLF